MSAAARTVISGWSALSAFGPASADFAAGMRDGGQGADQCSTGIKGGAVPGFDAREVLGRKGTRSMDRQTALAVAAAGQLLTGPDGERLAGVGPESGVVLGTTTASAQSMMDFARDILTQDKPFHVDPAQFPNTVLNCAAARCAIWHQLKGPNVTVSAGRASGLQALNYARRLHLAGRADVMLCGAVEELSADRAWLESGSGPLGEGCAMLLVEPAGRPGERGRTELAEVLALKFGLFHEPGGIGAALAACVRRALSACGESFDRVWAVASSGGPAPVGAGEAAALADLFGDRTLVRLCATDLVGDTNGAGAAFALVAVVAMASMPAIATMPAVATMPAMAAMPAMVAGPALVGPRTGLVTAVDPDGVVGCALLRLNPSEADHGEKGSPT